MTKEKIKELEERILFIEEDFEEEYDEMDDDEQEVFEDDVLDLREELEMYMEFEDCDDVLSPLLDRVVALEKEINIQKFGFESYEDWQKDTLDYMFPDRYDDDFDEDSMSYDSVFGDD